MADVLKYRIAGPTSSDTEILVSETVSTNLVDSGTTSIQLTMSLDNLAVVPGEVRGWFADGVNFNGYNISNSFNITLAIDSTNDTDIIIRTVDAKSLSDLEQGRISSFRDTFQASFQAKAQVFPPADSVTNPTFITFIDSARIFGLPDSNTLSLLDSTITVNLTATLDSDGIKSVISESYLNSLTIDADLLNGQPGSHYLNYNNLVNKPTLNDSVGIDSSNTILLINQIVDSSYVQSRQTTGGGSYTDSNAIAAITGSSLNMGSNDITTTGKIKFANVYNNLTDLPSASTYHGMFAHVHATGAGYFAHAGQWIRLANHADLGGGGSLDSDQVNTLIDAGITSTVNNTFINNLSDVDADLLNGQSGSYYLNYNNLVNKPTLNDSVGIDSSNTIILIKEYSVDSQEVISLIDSAYVQARQTSGGGGGGGVDSAYVASQLATIDSSYIIARDRFNDSSVINHNVTINGILKVDSVQNDGIGFARITSGSDIRLEALGEINVTGSKIVNLKTPTNDSDAANKIYVDTQIASLVDSVGVDSAGVVSIIDQNYIRSRQILYNTSDFADSGFVTNFVNSRPVSTFTNDKKYLDSTGAQSLINAAYIQARQTPIDSDLINSIVDSAYIQLRDRFQSDSAFVTNIVDTAYIQSKQLTFDFLDSSEAVQLIDSSYVQARQAASGVDSAYVNSQLSTQIAITNASILATIDSDYVQDRQSNFNGGVISSQLQVGTTANDAVYIQTGGTIIQRGNNNSSNIFDPILFHQRYPAQGYTSNWMYLGGHYHQAWNSAGSNTSYIALVGRIEERTNNNETGRFEIYGHKGGAWTRSYAISPWALYLTADQPIKWTNWGTTSFDMTLQPDTLTADRTVTLPNNSGTLAIAGDNSYDSNFVPVTGGTFTGDVVFSGGDNAVDIRTGTDKRISFSGNIGEIGSVAGFQASNDAGTGLRSMGMRANTLRFATGNDERMRIDADGLVGIGTTSPLAKLNVSNTTGGAYVRIDGAASGDISSGVQIYKSSTVAASFYANPTHDAVLQSDNGLTFRAGGTNRMRISDAGKIGIGDNYTGTADLDIEKGSNGNNGHFKLGHTHTRRGTVSISSSQTRWYKVISYAAGNMFTGRISLYTNRQGGFNQTGAYRLYNASVGGYSNGLYGPITATQDAGAGGNAEIVTGTDEGIYLKISSSIYGGTVFFTFEGSGSGMGDSLWVFNSGTYVTSAP